MPLCVCVCVCAHAHACVLGEGQVDKGAETPANDFKPSSQGKVRPREEVSQAIGTPLFIPLPREFRSPLPQVQDIVKHAAK